MFYFVHKLQIIKMSYWVDALLQVFRKRVLHCDTLQVNTKP